MQNEPLDKTFIGRLADKVYLANKRNRQENTDILVKKLDELKPAITETSAKDFLDKLASNFKGDTGPKPTDDELLALIKPLIPEPIPGKDGIDGKTPTKAELQALIKPLIPEPIVGPKGEKGQDSVVPGPRGPKGSPGKDGSPDTAEQLVEKLSTIKDAWLKVKAIKGLDELLNEAGQTWLNSAKAFIPRSLSALYDVNTRGISNGQTLVWDIASQKWIPGTASGGGTTTAGYTIEIPTGTIDGTNVAFTVEFVPVYIVSDGITYFEGFGYSRSGTIITMSVPPVSVADGGYIRSFHLGEVAVDTRLGYLTYLASVGFTPNLAVLFEEGTGSPIEHYSSLPITPIGGTVGWTTYLGQVGGSAPGTGDNWGLGASSGFINASTQTVLLVRRKRDMTLRDSAAFGIYPAPSNGWLQAHIPNADGIVHWNFRTPASELTWGGYTPTTNIEAWAFRAGTLGLSIWKDGVKVATNATPISLASVGASFYINSATFAGPDLVDVFFFALIPAEVSDAVLGTFTPTNVLGI